MVSTVRRRFVQAGLAATFALISAVPLADRACGQVATQPMVRQQAQRGGLNPDSFYGKETFQGVSVRDSLEAVKKIEDARRMERLEDWNKAADWRSSLQSGPRAGLTLTAIATALSPRRCWIRRSRGIRRRFRA